MLALLASVHLNNAPCCVYESLVAYHMKIAAAQIERAIINVDRAQLAALGKRL